MNQSIADDDKRVPEEDTTANDDSEYVLDDVDFEDITAKKIGDGQQSKVSRKESTTKSDWAGEHDFIKDDFEDGSDMDRLNVVSGKKVL